jgi:hypothetical protein
VPPTIHNLRTEARARYEPRGLMPKIKPEVYSAVIDEAHKNGLRVAAHVYDLDDAKAIVRAGVDIIAHGVRDKAVDAELIEMLKARSVWYIATIGLDESIYSFPEQAAWTQEPFVPARVRSREISFAGKGIPSAGDRSSTARPTHQRKKVLSVFSALFAAIGAPRCSIAVITSTTSRLVISWMLLLPHNFPISRRSKRDISPPERL